MTRFAPNQYKLKIMILLLMKCSCLWFLLAGVDAGELSAIVTPRDISYSDGQIGKKYENKVIKTEYGNVRGYETEPGIIEFFDIPYGAFPADRPFQEPTVPEPWETVHEKSEHTSRCPQIIDNKFEGSNECLTLSIFTPKDAKKAGVLFHIHDSFFITGSGDPLIYSPKFMVPKGIILVLPNYRLGPLGFLCLRNKTAPGNAGLKDLALALKWTMNNIEAFGGNSENIVVSGAGAGGAIVEYLLLSNSSKRFISKAITESGSVLSPWAIDRNPLVTANLFLERLAESEGELDAKYILKHMSLERLMRAGLGLTFRPCVESEHGFITESPWSLLQNGKFMENTSYISGSANQAAMDKVLQLTTEEFLELNENLTQLLPDDLQFESDNEKKNSARLVKSQYFQQNDISKNNRERLSLCYTDSQYINGGIRAARLFAKGGILVYFYEFSLDHRTPFNASGRGDSLFFIFKNNIVDSTSSYDNINFNFIRDLMTNLWINFINTGKPSADDIEWETLKYGSDDSEEWLSIGSKTLMRRGFHVDRLKLWNDLYNKHYADRNIAFEMKPSLHFADCIIVMMINLLACEVSGRMPVIPLARHRVVITTQGSARGYFAPRPPHYVFLGIPYARPPTRFNRYKDPQPPDPWSGIFEATHRVKCPQPDGSGEENCLVVNVFSPESAEAASVIVHIHDGGFQNGWGTFVGPSRLLEQGFVFVSFNYRIGALGFLCLGTEDILGNVGIKDQIAALYWIYKNIDKFGGNPSDITVYGTGSGAVSIEILLMSGFTKNLFHKAILESGSVLSPSAITRDPDSLAYNLAKFLGHRGDFSPQSLKEYYYKVPVHILTNISRIFRPCIEKILPHFHSILTRDPLEILESGEYQHVPMMIVYTNAEEVDIVSDNQDKFKSIIDNIDHLLPNNLIFDNNIVKEKITKMIKKFYFEDMGSNSIIHSLKDYINDIFMEYPIAKSATYHANRNWNPIYLMYFRDQINSKNKEISSAGYKKVFSYITSGNLLDYDEIIAQRLTKLWTNFINFSDPTPLTSNLLPIIWQPVETHEEGGKIVLRNIPCLEFGLKMGNILLSGQHLKFWENIYNKFYINYFEY